MHAASARALCDHGNPPPTMTHPHHAPIALNLDEVQCDAVRAQGAGGQNVNKVSTAIHLRFDIAASSLPVEIKARLLQARDQRVSKDGVFVLKAQRYRTQEANRQDAIARLQDWIAQAAHVPLVRKPTRPTRASRQRRLEGKQQRAGIKQQRARIAL